MIFLRYNGLSIALCEIHPHEADAMDKAMMGVRGIPVYVCRPIIGGVFVWPAADRDYTGFDDEGREYLFLAAKGD